MRTKYFIFLLIILLNSITLYSQYVETLVDSLSGSGDLSMDENGIIFVADWGDEPGNPNGTKIHKVYKDGSVEEFADGFMSASGNDFEYTGDLILSNYKGRYLSRISPTGEVTNFANNQFFAPLGLAVVNDSVVYVADCGREAIMRVNDDGNAIVFATHDEFNCPTGLSYSEEGILFVSNFRDGKIFKITSDGTVTKLAELPIDNSGHLVYSNGFVYAVGTCSRQIYRISMDGNFQVIAGSGERGQDDGPALEATFNQLNGIASSEDGDTLFVNDAISMEGDCLDDAPLNPVKIRMIIGVNSITSVGDQSSIIPTEFDLYQNYPNPFNPSTEIQFSIPEALNVSLKVYNALGEEVISLIDSEIAAGIYNVNFNADDLASGQYIYTLIAGDKYTESKKMLLVK